MSIILEEKDENKKDDVSGRDALFFINKQLLTLLIVVSVLGAGATIGMSYILNELEIDYFDELHGADMAQKGYKDTAEVYRADIESLPLNKERGAVLALIDSALEDGVIDDSEFAIIDTVYADMKSREQSAIPAENKHVQHAQKES